MAVKPIPPQALLAECVDPVLPPGKTDNDVGVTLVKLAEAYVDCKQGKSSLIKWVEGALK